MVSRSKELGTHLGQSVTCWRPCPMVGAQSIGIALQSGGQRKAAMLLLKQGFGVKDAYVIPCASASEQKLLMRRLAEETGALEVPFDCLKRVLPMMLAEDLAASASSRS